MKITSGRHSGIAMANKQEARSRAPFPHHNHAKSETQASRKTRDPGVTVTFEHHMEIYQPAYLFNADGSLATRPFIVSIAGSGTTSDMFPIVNRGAPFTVQTPDAANISSVVLVRPGATTHSFNTDQRLVGLTFTAGNRSLTVTVPTNPNLTPPAYYMLFLVNSAGVPSVAAFVEVQ